MRNYLALCLLGALLVSCSSLPIHHLEIEQGNIMNSEQVNRLHPGQSEAQVKAIIGPPVMESLLNNGDLAYIYTFQIRNAPRAEKRLYLLFHHKTLAAIQRTGI